MTDSTQAAADQIGSHLRVLASGVIAPVYHAVLRETGDKDLARAAALDAWRHELINLELDD